MPKQEMVRLGLEGRFRPTGSWKRGCSSCRNRMTLLLLLNALVHQLGQVLSLLANAVGNLDNGAAPLQLQFLANIEVLVALPVRISNEVSAVVINHDAFVEGVVFESSILPPLLLPSQVTGEETYVFDHQGSASRGGEGSRA